MVYNCLHRTMMINLRFKQCKLDIYIIIANTCNAITSSFPSRERIQPFTGILNTMNINMLLINLVKKIQKP